MLVPRLYNVDDKAINKYEAVGGLRSGKETEALGGNPLQCQSVYLNETKQLYE